VEAETVIIGAAQGGNEPAWRQLFAWHFDAVYRFCLALAAGRNRPRRPRRSVTPPAVAGSICAGRVLPGYGIARIPSSKPNARRRTSIVRPEAEAAGTEADLYVHERLPACRQTIAGF
jgi:hypothetical protein